MRPACWFVMALLASGSAQASPPWQVLLQSGELVGDRDPSYRQTLAEITYTPHPDYTTRWRLRHDYRVLDLADDQGVAAASNGHVHALSLSWRARLEDWAFELTPVLAVSSNVLKNPDDIQADDWQLHGAVTRRTSGPADGHWYWGVRADSRLGRYLPYPVVQWQSPDYSGVGVGLGAPDSYAYWDMHPAWRLSLSLGPAGGYWQVRDKSLKQVSHLAQRRWHTTLDLHWQATRHVGAVLGWSHYWHRRWAYRLEDGRRVHQQVPDGSLISLSLVLGNPNIPYQRPAW